MADQSHRVLLKEISEEETSMLNSFIDVLNKTCESEFIYTTENHCRELQKQKYFLRRALVEFKQLIKEKTAHDVGSGVRCSNYWLWRLDVELKYNFLQLLPSLKTRLDVKHDDFVSTVHSADRTMRDYSDQIPESFKETFVAILTAEMLKSSKLVDIARLLLREWACGRTDHGEVIVCSSNSALSVISSKGAKEYGETGMGLKRWMMEKVFPLLSNKLVAENIIVYIETDQEETGELLFRLESAYS